MLTQARLKEVLHYDPETGVFTWIKSPRYGWIGKKAGTLFRGQGKSFYLRITINKKQYLAHRLAFLYMTGEFPAGILDHKDCDGLNNKFDNLRECTNSQNIKNVPRKANNRSGHKNVHWGENIKKWRVCFKIDGRNAYFGNFIDIDEAAAVADKLRSELYGEFARHD